MTVKELKEKLQEAPDNMEVMLLQTDDESPYNLVNTAEIREITFSSPEFEDEESEDFIHPNDLPREKVFVITDEF